MQTNERLDEHPTKKQVNHRTNKWKKEGTNKANSDKMNEKVNERTIMKQAKEQIEEYEQIENQTRDGAKQK